MSETDAEALLRDQYLSSGWTLNRAFEVARKRHGWSRGKVREVLFGRAY